MLIVVYCNFEGKCVQLREVQTSVRLKAGHAVTISFSGLHAQFIMSGSCNLPAGRVQMVMATGVAG